MQTINAVEIFNMSIPERIQLVEDIWDSIAVLPDIKRFFLTMLYCDDNDAVKIEPIANGKCSSSKFGNNLPILRQILKRFPHAWSSQQKISRFENGYSGFLGGIFIKLQKISSESLETSYCLSRKDYLWH